MKLLTWGEITVTDMDIIGLGLYIYIYNKPAQGNKHIRGVRHR